VTRPQVTAAPVAQASSHRGQHVAALALDGNEATYWRSAHRPGSENRAAVSDQTFEVDLQYRREFGAVEIDWAGGLQASRYSIESSLDGRTWQTLRRVEASNGGRDSHRLPESEARYIRVKIPDGGKDVG